MSEKSDGGPAFPAERYEQQGMNGVFPDYQRVRYPGMTLRDYFAAKAMQGLSAQVLTWNHDVRASGEALTNRGVVMLPDIAEVAYGMADAMLAERDK